LKLLPLDEMKAVAAAPVADTSAAKSTKEEADDKNRSSAPQ
jgi:hypothetical protein